MSRSVTSSSAKRKPLAAMVPTASACTGVKVRTSLCVNDSTRLMRPSEPGCSAAASRKSPSVSDSPASAVSTEPCRPRSPSRRATRAARSMRAASRRGIRPEPLAMRENSLCSTPAPSAMRSLMLTS